MGDGPLFDWSWVSDNAAEITSRVAQHLQLTAIAIVVGFLISFPLALYCFRHRRAYGFVAGVTGVMYTIPSLAFFAFLLPVTGLTVTTAEIALVSYTLLILIRAIVAGLDRVPDDAREAALGMGYSRRQLLWKVEIPLALPVIVGGLRLATVTTVGLVTVTALIGLGGLGHFILSGLRMFESTPILLGAVLSLILAVIIDGILVLAERSLTPWARRRQEAKVFV
jgi:osmoprotectant transport system permease protein